MNLSLIIMLAAMALALPCTGIRYYPAFYKLMERLAEGYYQTERHGNRYAIYNVAAILRRPKLNYVREASDLEGSLLLIAGMALFVFFYFAFGGHF